MSDHPNNYAALWALSPKRRSAAPDGSLIIERPRERLDEDDICATATPSESAAFVQAIWGPGGRQGRDENALMPRPDTLKFTPNFQ